MRINFPLLLFLVFLPAFVRSSEWSLTVMPAASMRYRGEGKVQPETYTNRFDGQTSPVYRLEVRQDYSADGYWGVSFWHTGVFGGGKFAQETLPDATTGGTYQTNKLNVGFTNVFLDYHQPLEYFPAEALVRFSVVREIFKRKNFVVKGVDAAGSLDDDVNEISAEGLGVGLAGRHGKRFYFRWQSTANYYVQIFDAKTDPSAGQIFQAEGGAGVRLGKGLSLEIGALWQYWFTHSQGNRRLHVSGPVSSGAVISWNRQETRTQGAFLRLEYSFSK